MSTIIGISGYARSGKDSIGKILVEQHGYTRLSFADLLREALLLLNPDIVDEVTEQVFTLEELIADRGWERAKTECSEVRRMLQVLGTDIARNMIGEDSWVNAMERRIAASGADKIVITDVRFPNEADFVRSFDGMVLRVFRPGVGPANDHVSEIGMDDYTCEFSIHNEGTLDELEEKVTNLLRFVTGS